MSKFFKMAIVLALMPLVIGVLVFILWYFTRYELLMMIGMIDFRFGIICVLGALICCFVAVFENMKKGQIKSAVMAAATVLLLIIVDFATAAGIFVMADAILSQFQVTIVNNSNSQIGKIVVSVPGHSETISRVPKGKSEKISVTVKGEGAARISFWQDDKLIDAEPYSYVCSGMGCKVTLYFDPNGNYRITSDPNS